MEFKEYDAAGTIKSKFPHITASMPGDDDDIEDDTDDWTDIDDEDFEDMAEDDDDFNELKLENDIVDTDDDDHLPDDDF